MSTIPFKNYPGSKLIFAFICKFGKGTMLANGINMSFNMRTVLTPPFKEKADRHKLHVNVI